MRHRVAHDVEQAFDVARRLRAARCVHSQTTRDRAAHRCQVESFAFDGGGGDRFAGPGVRGELQPDLESQGGQPAFQATQRPARVGQRLRDTAVVMQVGPAVGLPQVVRFGRHEANHRSNRLKI